MPPSCVYAGVRVGAQTALRSHSGSNAGMVKGVHVVFVRELLTRELQAVRSTRQPQSARPRASVRVFVQTKYIYIYIDRDGSDAG